MKRREFIAALGGAAALPFAARAQQTGRLPRVGVLMAGAENSDENAPRVAAFRKALAELGWKDGENVRVEYRWSAGQAELIERYAKELVMLAPDVILANSTPVISTLKGMTSSIPVVFALSMDPVGLGNVQSLSRPGGNFTGFTFIDPELIGKWMGLLQDVAPGLDPGRAAFQSGHRARPTSSLAGGSGPASRGDCGASIAACSHHRGDGNGSSMRWPSGPARD